LFFNPRRSEAKLFSNTRLGFGRLLTVFVLSDCFAADVSLIFSYSEAPACYVK
jgi:hypothetical protein